jgi:four helix bundle protein
VRNFKKIKAYQLADGLVLDIYEATKLFPKEELYGLTSQIRRAAVSTAANIVEGASRQHQKDYLNFLYTARGSAAEVNYLLSVAYRLSYFETKIYEKLDILVKEVARTLFGLIQSVGKEVGLKL